MGNFLNIFLGFVTIISRFAFVCVSLSAAAQGVYAVEHYTNTIRNIQHC